MIAAMKRRLVRVAAFLPVPLLALVLAVWVRSYAPEDFYCRTIDGRVVLFFVNGVNSAWLEPRNAESYGARRLLKSVRDVKDNAIDFRCLGVEVLGTRNSWPAHFVVVIPFGWIALPLAAAATWWVVAYRRRRDRERTGSCRACGYDLRGSPGRCPECGAAANDPATPPAASSR
jgi:hypothetical protein